MHVLIIPSWYPAKPGDIGGSFFREQAIALAKAGLKVGVISPQFVSLRKWRSLLSPPSFAPREMDCGVLTFRKRAGAWLPRVPYGQSSLWVRKGMQLFDEYVAANGRPDIIHAHSALFGGVLAKEIARRFRIPYVLTEHSSAFTSGEVKAWHKKLAIEVAREAKRRFAVSGAYCSVLEGSLGTAAGAWEELPNIVNSDFLNTPLEKPEGKETFTFMSIALLIPRKGMDVLLNAFARAFRGVHGVSLIIGGDGPSRAELEALARTLDVEGQVTFTGALKRSEVVSRLSEIDAFVLPSRAESFGVVVVEALALGKPVVVTRCGGPESIVRPQDGIVVPADDVESLASALAAIRENAGKYDAAKIREGCRERYAEDGITRRLIAAYKAAV